MSLFTTLLLARVQERGGRAGDQVRSDQELPRPAFTTPRSLKMRSACMVGWVGMLAARSAGHSSLINPISRNSVGRTLPQWANGLSLVVGSRPSGPARWGIRMYIMSRGPAPNNTCGRVEGGWEGQRRCFGRHTHARCTPPVVDVSLLPRPHPPAPAPGPTAHPPRRALRERDTLRAPGARAAGRHLLGLQLHQRHHALHDRSDLQRGVLDRLQGELSGASIRLGTTVSFTPAGLGSGGTRAPGVQCALAPNRYRAGGTKASKG